MNDPSRTRIVRRIDLRNGFAVVVVRVARARPLRPRWVMVELEPASKAAPGHCVVTRFDDSIEVVEGLDTSAIHRAAEIEGVRSAATETGAFRWADQLRMLEDTFTAAALRRRAERRRSL